MIAYKMINVNRKQILCCCITGAYIMAGLTRLELAASCVTGRRSNQLNYNPVSGAVDQQYYSLFSTNSATG